MQLSRRVAVAAVLLLAAASTTTEAAFARRHTTTAGYVQARLPSLVARGTLRSGPVCMAAAAPAKEAGAGPSIGWDSHKPVDAVPESLVRGVEGNESMRRRFEKACRDAQVRLWCVDGWMGGREETIWFLGWGGQVQPWEERPTHLPTHPPPTAGHLQGRGGV